MPQFPFLNRLLQSPCSQPSAQDQAHSFFCLPLSGEVSPTSLKSTVVGHQGAAGLRGVAGEPSLTPYCPSPQFPDGTQADGRNPLWFTASFHTLPTTYRLAALSHVQICLSKCSPPREGKSVPNIGVEGNYGKMGSKKETYRWPKSGGMPSVKTEQIITGLILTKKAGSRKHSG